MKQLHASQPLFSFSAVGALACLLLLAPGCGVESTSSNTGGLGGNRNTDNGNNTGSGGAGGSGDTVDDPTGPENCPSGVNVLLSDYLSTQIALSDLDGKTLSESVISTASSQTDGLAFALSGDVVLPSTAPASGDVVLLDRYGTNVVTWVDPQSGKVIDQLPVGTGFESNPQDYLEIDSKTAWITRWGQNTDPGMEAFDEGGDVLVIDLEKKEIAGSIIMPSRQDLPARPGAMSFIGDEVFVSLDRISLDFGTVGEAMVVSLDPSTGEENFQQTLTGHKACGRMTASPDGSILAMACTGALGWDGSIEDISQSAVVLFDTTKRPLQVIERIQAVDILNIPLQGSLTFVDNETVLLKTQTPWGGAGNNELFSLNLKTKQVQKLLEASANEDGSGKGLVYNSVFCAPGCSDVCLMGDADQGVLQVLDISSPSDIQVQDTVTVEKKVGLPPLGVSGR